MPSIQKVREWHVESFSEIFGLEIQTESDVLKFAEISRRIKERHQHTVQLMGNGILELKKELKKSLLAGSDDLSNLDELHSALSKN